MHSPSSRARLLRAATLPAASIALLIAASPALAQSNPEYRLLDLGSLGLSQLELLGAPDTLGTFGLNNHGWAVWFVEEEIIENEVVVGHRYRAKVFRPDPNVTGGQIAYIDELITSTPFESAARDINDCGLVVGQVDNEFDSSNRSDLRQEGDAVVWDLSNVSLTYPPNITGGTWTPRWSRGVAITNDDPASIVCETEVFGLCPSPCDIDGPYGIFLASYRHQLGDTTSSLLLTLPSTNDCDQTSLASDVASYGLSPAVVGSVHSHQMNVGGYEIC